MEWVAAGLAAILFLSLVAAAKSHNAATGAQQKATAPSSDAGSDLNPNKPGFLDDENILDNLEDDHSVTPDDHKQPKTDRAIWLYRFLAHRKRNGKPTTYSDIHEETGWGNSTIKTNLEYLMRNGWVHREAYPANRRMYQYVILKGSEKDATTNS